MLGTVEWSCSQIRTLNVPFHTNVIVNFLLIEWSNNRTAFDTEVNKAYIYFITWISLRSFIYSPRISFEEPQHITLQPSWSYSNKTCAQNDQNYFYRIFSDDVISFLFFTVFAIIKTRIKCISKLPIEHISVTAINLLSEGTFSRTKAPSNSKKFSLALKVCSRQIYELLGLRRS